MIDLKNLGVLKTAKRKRAATNPTRALPGIDELAAIDRAIKMLQSLKTELHATVKQRAIETFIANGCEHRQHPGNYHGEDQGSTASLELKKLGGAVSDELIALAEAHGIPLQTDIEVHELYAINPEYADDAKLMRKAIKALNDAKLPSDFLKQQEGEVVTRTTPDTINAIFKLPRDVAKRLLGAFSVVAVAKLSYKGSDEEALAQVAQHGIEMKLAA